MNPILLLPFLCLSSATPPDVTMIQAPGKVLTPASFTISTNESVGVRYAVSNFANATYGTQYVPIVQNGVTVRVESLGGATVDRTGTVLYESNGTARIRVVSARGFQSFGHVVQVPMRSVSSSGSEHVFIDFLTGSLAAHVASGMSNLVAGRYYDAALSRAFTTRNGSTGIFVRNPSCILHGKPGFSAVSPSRTPDGGTWFHATGVALTKRHVYSAAHNAPPIGAGFYFVSDANTVYSRSIIARTNIGSDITVSLLNADLPADIQPMKVMPSDWLTAKMPCVLTDSWPSSVLFDGNRVPVLAMNQDECVFIADLLRSNGMLSVDASTRFPSWKVSLRGGDSGKPAMVLVDGELCFLMGWTWINAGYSIAAHISEVNNAMAGMSTANSAPIYTLSVKDLSPFNSY